MAWSWSHTAEAYRAAELNLRNLDKETLEIIFAEWRAAQDKDGEVRDSNKFDQRKYDRALKYAKGMDTDCLADFIWEKAENAATCDNGGWQAWMCPSGCGCHCVPFSPPEGVDLEDMEYERA